MLNDGLHGVAKGKLAMIVTHLEMRAQASMKEVSLPEGITFRQVQATPEWYRDIFTRVGSMEWLWYGRLKMPDTELQAIINDPKVKIFTLSKDGKDEALLELDFRVEGECELAYFGLTPKLIGTGAGRYLMNQAISYAWDAGITRFHVHTCTMDSPQALNFYVRSGFTPYKREVEIDDDPRLIGVLPKNVAGWVPII